MEGGYITCVAGPLQLVGANGFLGFDRIDRRTSDVVDLDGPDFAVIVQPVRPGGGEWLFCGRVLWVACGVGG